MTGKFAKASGWANAVTLRLRNVGADAWDTVMDPAGPDKAAAPGKPQGGQDNAQAQMIFAHAQANAPVVWMLGKVQSGKSSIVQALTGCTDAQIGLGFKSCTTTAELFDFPSSAPIIRFLDTRGLGESAYDPRDDIAICAGQAQLLLVVVKALDPQQQVLVDLLRELRARNPDWPVIVAQSCLHDAYGSGQGHALPYAYGAEVDADVGADVELDAELALANDSGETSDLAQALRYQRHLFANVKNADTIKFVPLDFTLADDGYEPRLYGLDALLDAIAAAAPSGLAAMLRDSARQRADLYAAAAHPHILGYASAAAAIDVVPVAGLIGVPGVQAKLLHSLARIYGVEWNRRLWLEFTAQLGAGVAARIFTGLGVRQLVKLVPAYGQTIGAASAAAASFVTTYALGRAATVFLVAKHAGAADAAGVAQAYREGLSRAFELVKERRFAPAPEHDERKERKERE